MKEIPKGKNHPLVYEAYDYIRDYIADYRKLVMLQESLSGNAIENNEAAVICLATLDLVIDGKPVGERYVFGLAWLIKRIVENK